MQRLSLIRSTRNYFGNKFIIVLCKPRSFGEGIELRWVQQLGQEMAHRTLDFLLLVSLMVCMLCSQVTSKRRQSRLRNGGLFQQDEAPPIAKEDLDTIIASGISKLKVGGHEDITLFFGSVKSRKEVLVKYLTRDESLKVKQKSNVYRFSHTKHGANQILHPELKVDSYTGDLLVSLPSFDFGKENPAIDIAANFLTKNVIQQASTFKIIIVESDDFLSQLPETNNRFLTTLHKVTRFLPDVSNFLESIGLVVTNVKTRKSLAEFVDQLKKFFEKLSVAQRRSKSPNKAGIIQLLNILVKGQNNIAIQLRPSEVTYNKGISSDYEQLRFIAFDSLNFTEAKTTDFRFPVCKRTANYTRFNLIKPSEDRVKNGFQSFAHRTLRHLVTKIVSADVPIEDKVIVAKRESRRFLKHLKRPKGFVFTADLLLNSRTDLKYQTEHEVLTLDMQKLEFFYDSVDLDTNSFFQQIHMGLVDKTDSKLKVLIASYQFMLQLKKFLDSYIWLKHHLSAKDTTYKTTFRSITSKNYFQFIEFLRSKGFEFNVKNFELHLATLNDLNSVWVDSINFQVIVSNSHGSLIISGKYVLLSLIYVLHGNSASAYKNIAISATTEIYIDHSLTLLNAHLTLIAPTIVVHGKQGFTLYGENGKSAETIITGTFFHRRTVHNEPLPGYRSGSFSLFATDIKNGNNFNLYLVGGMGGSGQKGGRGRDGTDASVERDGEHVLNKVRSHSAGGRSCETYTFEKSCLFSYTVHSYSTGSSGESGGNGIAGAQAGEVILKVKNYIRDVQNKMGIVAKTGKDGNVGIGGSPGRSTCISKSVTAKCYYRYGFLVFTDTLNSCNHQTDYCCSWTSHTNGPNGKIKQVVSTYKNPKSTPKEAVSTYFRALYTIADQNKLNSKQQSQFTAYLLKGPGNYKFYTLEWFYMTTLDVFTTKMNNAKLSDMVTELHSAYKVFNAKFSKYYTKDELNTLELAFISELDLLEASRSKRQIIKVEAELRRLKEQGNDIEAKLKDIYKYDSVKKHMGHIQAQIDEGEKQTKEVVQIKLADLSKQIDGQLQMLVNKVKEQQNDVKKKTKQLIEDRIEYKKNMWKRLITGPLNIIAKVVSVVKPQLESTANQIAETAESLLIKERPPVDKIELPLAVQNAKRLRAEIIQIEFRGEQAKNKIYIKGIEDTLSNDKRFNHSVLTDSFRSKLKSKLTSLKAPNFVLPEDFEEEIQNILEEARDIVDKKNTGLSSDVKSENDSMTAVKVLTFISPPLAEFVGTVLGDAAKVNEITNSIKENQIKFEKLQQYEEDVHEYFKPALDGMINNYEQFATDGSQSTDFELQFNQLQLRDMVRKSISFIHQFTEGLLQEDNDLIRIMSDVEATLAAVLKNYEKLNDLKYKLQFSALVGSVNLGACNPDNSIICRLRLQLEGVIQTSILKQKYYHLERAYRQTIFPFINRNLEMLSPVDVMDVGDYQTVSKSLKNKVTKMLELIEDSKNWIDSTADRNVHLAEFNPVYRSSEAFFTWLQPHHSEQIRRLMSGELVTFIADVRHRKVNNAVKFSSVSLNVTSFDPQAAREIQRLLQFLEVTLEHGGENHFRCQDDYYVVGGGPETPFRHSFEHNRRGELISQNLVQSKFSLGDVPFSPYTVWRFQLKQRGKSRAQLLELANLAKFANVELIGRGSYLDENDAACKEDLQKHFDVFD